MVYTSLDPLRKQIRLLTLIDGSWDEGIKCVLSVASLHDDPIYEALSYVWGSPNDLLEIVVDGRPRSVTRNLHDALKRLRRQKGDVCGEVGRTLWVDAVCINQSDHDEKRYQVELMGEIYSRTARSLLWLGEQPDESEQAIDKQGDEMARLLEETDNIINDILSALPDQEVPLSDPHLTTDMGTDDFLIPRTRAEHWVEGFDMSKLNESEKFDVENDSVFQVGCLLTMLAHGAHLNCIAHLQQEPDANVITFRTHTRRTLGWLVSRPWWKRIWTVQECILPKESLLLYGPARLSWGLLLAAMSNFQKHRTGCCSEVPGVRDMFNNILDTILPCEILNRYIDSDGTLDGRKDADDSRHRRDVSALFRPEFLLWTFRYREATDPRDKIYGILSLLKGCSATTGQPARKLIIPDYSIDATPERVFTRVVHNIIEFSASLDILCQPGHIQQNVDSDLPSWVTDFAKPVNFAGALDQYIAQLPYYDACGGRSAAVRTIEENILVLEGVAVDLIEEFGTAMMYPAEEGQKSVFEDWYALAASCANGKNLAGDGGSVIVDGTGWKEAFWRTICGDTILNWQPAILQNDFEPPLKRISPLGSPEREGQEAAFNRWCQVQGLETLQTNHSPSSEDGSKSKFSIGNIAHTIKISTMGKKFFLSQGGRMGLAPFYAGLSHHRILRKNRVLVFPGGKAPFVLRPVGKRHVPGLGMRPCHELVGICYLHGFMDGEGMEDFETKKETIYLV
ncbi:heterokaryon incompatibility protein-domain-containing protein [Hypomontagnella monticulosa]|nr:heterokaryon incompatibility protein-domain-containing protein [Hypomontagnella monticulosa]